MKWSALSVSRCIFFIKRSIDWIKKSKVWTFSSKFWIRLSEDLIWESEFWFFWLGELIK